MSAENHLETPRRPFTWLACFLMIVLIAVFFYGAVNIGPLAIDL
jgi:hypothetical protein